ncbi:RNA-directed DNA polymerase (Reverse transcriptase) [Microseira wollei NIES-4236]|uniref:RNA-directed DNA polymerase (Reverse transcriptase) n=2 Tax=Microseira wollei TaxID=467598 RepID=A0AAV3X3Y1_9CYAN|nr:RNA-directed DNA polymerase (Reverse transcriptase) [Microseira wollei NIES-4236]
MEMTKTREKPMVVWTQVNWRQLERTVYKLQKRIYQASGRGDVKAVRKLQKTLLNSWSAKMLAVRQVTQDNQGKNTAGIDGQKALTPKARLELVEALELSHKSAPTRRVWIPKPRKTEKRPLGIPTITERAKQALVKLALEPEWEAKFEPNSYGFRPGRSCMDAIEGIKVAIKQKSKYVLDADIAKCFDKIDQKKLLNKINTFPKLRRQIKAWVKSGVYDSGTWFPTDEGTPQGGIISPLLANIALHGMEKIVKEFARTLPGKKDNNEKEITLVRYADDFVILHPKLDVLMRSKTLIEEFLNDIGLELRPEKTRITHTLERMGEETPGFDFLGFNIRQYPVGKYTTGKNTHGKPLGYKTYIKPSKEAVKAHYQRLANEIDKLKSCQSQIELIKRLNPIITGWSNYYSKVNSAETFKELDHLLTRKLIAWTKARHLHKSTKRWIGKYFGIKDGSSWVFRAITDNKNIYLVYHSDFQIQKFVKVKGKVSPYNGDFIYWATRMGKSVELPTRVSKLLKKQNGKCTECGLYFRDEDVMEVDHVIPRSKGGKDRYDNYQLLHRHCHDIKTKRDGTHDKSQIIEEPCDAKVSRTVLKPSHIGDNVA